MASDPITLRGVVLSSRDFKEKDKIISFLSSTSGVIDICVKGTSKQGSKLAAITVPFIVADVVVTLTGNFYYVKDYSIVESNSSIMSSLEAMTVASHMTSVLSSSYISGSDSKPFYELLVYSLYYLSQNLTRYLVVYSAFNWRLLSILGYVIDYGYCMNCHNEIADKLYHAGISSGEIYCSDCFKNTKYNSADYYVISSSVVLALNYFLTAPFNKLFSVKIDDVSLKSMTDFTTRYISHHLDGEFSALSNLEMMLNLFK